MVDSANNTEICDMVQSDTPKKKRWNGKRTIELCPQLMNRLALKITFCHDSMFRKCLPLGFHVNWSKFQPQDQSSDKY